MLTSIFRKTYLKRPALVWQNSNANTQGSLRWMINVVV